MSTKTPNTGSGKVQGEAHPFWKGDLARTTTKRERAHRRYTLSVCEQCGAPATDRHHRDDDTGNNAPDNIMRLCRRCHMVLDGRLEALKLMAVVNHERNRKPDRTCEVCGRIAPPKRMWKHRCHRCHEYWRRNGIDRPFGSGNATTAGEVNGRARLTWTDVDAIRASKESLRLTAIKYGVAKSTIADIRNGRNWTRK